MKFEYLLIRKKIDEKESFNNFFRFLLINILPLPLIMCLLWFLNEILSVKCFNLRFFFVVLISIFSIYIKRIQKKHKREKKVTKIINLIESYIEKEKFDEAKDLLENVFLDILNKAFKEPLRQENDKRMKDSLYLRYVELRANILFNKFINNYNDIQRLSLIEIHDNIIKKSKELNQKENMAYAYANKAIVNIFAYENKKIDKYKTDAKYDYDKAIECTSENILKQELKIAKKRLAT